MNDLNWPDIIPAGPRQFKPRRVPIFFYAPGLSSGNVNVGSPNAILKKPFPKGGICWLPGRYF